MRHWSKYNAQGLCSYKPCQENNTVESTEHVLLQCPSYDNRRTNMINLCLKTPEAPTRSLVTNFLFGTPKDKLVQLLLDPSPLPEVISCAQCYGDQVFNDIFYLGRTWCFSLHRERAKRLGLWNFK